MTARYQRGLTSGAIGNGLNDGWRRPDGVWPPPLTAGRQAEYEKRGAAQHSRFLCFWIGIDIRKRRDVHCNFDTLEDAQAEIAAHPDVMSGGIWDRRKQRWAQ